MRKLETQRLLLRNFTPEDWKPLQEMIVWYMASPFGAYDQQWPTSGDKIRAVCNMFAGADDYLAVCLKDSGKFIGFIGFNPTDEARTYNIGYVFHERYHGKGYAVEGCTAYLDYMFGTLGAAKVVSGTAAANQPSCRLLQKLGMKFVWEGQAAFRDDEQGNPLVFTGVEFEITRQAWESSKKN